LEWGSPSTGSRPPGRQPPESLIESAYGEDTGHENSALKGPNRSAQGNADPASTIDAIDRAVAARFVVLRGLSRRASVAKARHLARTLTGSSFTAIGRISAVATRPPSDTPERPPRGASRPIPPSPPSL
jgi:hypothetical protein